MSFAGKWLELEIIKLNQSPKENYFMFSLIYGSQLLYSYIKSYDMKVEENRSRRRRMIKTREGQEERGWLGLCSTVTIYLHKNLKDNNFLNGGEAGGTAPSA